MDLRTLPSDLSPADRVLARQRMIECACGVDLSPLAVSSAVLGHSEERNCENMFGVVPIPVGLAGPLSLTLSNGTETTVHLPLATTEGALVASVNRGCKALEFAGGVRTSSVHRGVTRSVAWKVSNKTSDMEKWIRTHEKNWKTAGEATSSHLKILGYDIDERDDHLFLTIEADTDEAMGMNMVTIAADAIGSYVEKSTGAHFIIVAANVDSDKKPSKRTHEKGRGYEASASCHLPSAVIGDVLKTTPEAMLGAAKAKLELGSDIAGAIGKNCHAANVIAALYLATGQDAAHVVEGSMADTTVRLPPPPYSPSSVGGGGRGVEVSVRLPALMIGIRGGGTTLPAQRACLEVLLGKNRQTLQLSKLRNSANSATSLHPCRRFAEIIAAAVLAGEISLLAAQASHSLARAHATLARKPN